MFRFVRGFVRSPDDAGGAPAPVVVAPAALGGAVVTPAAAAPIAAAAVAAPAVTKSFAETLPADIRENAAFKDIKDSDALARSYLNAQKLIGVPRDKLLVMPAEGDETAQAEFYTKLGRPEAPDKYGFKAPDGVTVDPALQSSYAEAAHKAGLSTKQATDLYAWWNGMGAQAGAAKEAASVAAVAAATAALKTEWGSAFDERMGLAKQALSHYGNAKMSAELEATLQGNNPEVIRLFAKLGAGLREDGLIGKGGGGGEPMASPTEAQQQINGLKGDKTFMQQYLTKNDPGHAAALAKWTALHAAAFPTVTA
jgi:hypothetical protein